MSDPFDSARAKIARGRELIGELHRKISGYQGARLVSENRPDSFQIVLRMTDAPPNVAAVLGDAIHNLRASLDHLAVSLVKLNGRSASGVHFPFGDSQAGLEDQIKRHHFDRASPEAVNLLRGFSPHRGGNDTLRALHDLDLLDKHNDMIPIWSAAVQQVPINLPGGIIIAGTKFDMRDGQVLVRADGPQPLHFPDMPVSLVGIFPRESPFARKELVPTLTDLADVVEGIVNAFVALYGR